ncbi:4-hydroxybenzoate polyprenyltransferase-related prenyltransferase [Pyrobaculum oguniense TE7]|uniref:4-hydroxybenzoate polyprenyltransferase-related prenyltransferase n=1 Tax=Pyrobaculum oguniense (strain DSM 13380 / JCM 10595 / TE7) TaxID=698757 RepID=H6Q9A1_PYROT|nr:4-hydroxybenzoate polyprenyltransferase-related prenyltransferase [Pyrobaculum oguniense TE7]
MSLWKLIRGEHGVLAALASTASYAVAGGNNAATLVLLAASTFLAQAGLFAHNDLSNLEEDRVNRPDAPLVSGRVSLATARAVAYGSLVAGAACAATLGLAPLSVYLTAAVLGVLYNVRLKRVPVVGNLIVAFLTSMTYIYGMAAAGRLSDVLMLLFASSLVANVGREFVKTAMDYQGDMRAGLKTLAVLIGPQKTAAVGGLVTAASAALGVWLVMDSASTGLYALAAGAGLTSALLVYMAYLALRGQWRTYRNGTLAAFGITLIALVAEAAWRLF